MIKAVFFDIDGTLVSFETHRVPRSARMAIDELRAKGIKVFIATGRHKSAINNLGDMQFDGFVTINGGYCMLSDGTCIYRNCISRADMEALLNYQQLNPFPCVTMDDNEMYINFHNRNVEKVLEMLAMPKLRVRRLKDSLQYDVLQIIAFFEKENESEIMAVMPGCESTRWFPLFTDIVPRGSNKSVGIDKMLAHFNILPEETMAFGDGGNDMTMLQHVGLGVAMGNAEDVVKACAGFVTDTVDADGVYKALKKFELL